MDQCDAAVVITQKLYNPLLVCVEFIGSYYLIYFTVFSTGPCATTGHTS